MRETNSPKIPKGTKTRKERFRAQREATRRTLMDGAVACFARWGFADTTIDQIVDSAGVSHATFYKHFESKEAVFAEIEGEANRVLLERILEHFASVGRGLTARALIRGVAQSNISQWDARRDVAEAIVTGPRPSYRLQDRVLHPTPEMCHAISRHIERFAAQNGVEVPEPEFLVAALIGAWSKVAVSYLASTGSDGGELASARAVDFLERMTISMIAEHLRLDGAAFDEPLFPPDPV